MDFHFLIRRQKRIKTLKTAAASFSRNGCGSFIILQNSQRVDFHHPWPCIDEQSVGIISVVQYTKLVKSVYLVKYML